MGPQKKKKRIYSGTHIRKEHPASDLLSDPGVLWGQYICSSRSWGVPFKIVDLIGVSLSNGDNCGYQVHSAVIPYFIVIFIHYS